MFEEMSGLQMDSPFQETYPFHRVSHLPACELSSLRLLHPRPLPEPLPLSCLVLHLSVPSGGEGGVTMVESKLSCRLVGRHLHLTAILPVQPMSS